MFSCFAYDGDKYDDDFNEEDLQRIIDMIPPEFGHIDINDVVVVRLINLDDDNWDEEEYEEEYEEESEEENWNYKINTFSEEMKPN